MIRKRDKGIAGFGHEQVLQNNIAWSGYGIAMRSLLLANGQGQSGKLPGFGSNACEHPTKYSIDIGRTSPVSRRRAVWSEGQMDQLSNMLYLASIWVIPVVIAITFHEAAHGFVARFLGDDTAWKLGRVSLNPLKHIDPVGTILLPGFLLLLHSPFLFGYAKPVPVNFRALRNPRSGMVWVAAAGPAMNIALAILAALAFHLVGQLPANAAQWVAENLKSALIVNVVLAVFNMFPLPPLDGGRIAVGVLPDALASPLARLEPYGMLILIGLLFILPMLGTQLGVDLSIVSRVIASSTGAILHAILQLTGNT
jgi:Zn-dependent protease